MSSIRTEDHCCPWDDFCCLKTEVLSDVKELFTIRDYLGMALLGTINTGKQGRTHIFTGTVILAGGILAILTGPFETIVLFRKEQSMI